MESHSYVFTALKGVQANRGYYVTMCPLKLVPRIFLFEGEEVPAELRAQRTLNRVRVPEIARYLVENRSDYTFSSIAASIDGEVKFEPLVIDGLVHDDIGKLHISMDARFIINDGQHRRAAIEEALKEEPDIGNETISVVFFVDPGLQRSQQMFADLNKHSVRPTKSIGILYDHRDPLSTLARTIVEKVRVFKKLTEMEKTTISNRSTKLFTLSAIYQSTAALLRKSLKSSQLSDSEIATAIDFWKYTTGMIPDWVLAANKEVSTFQLRRDTIHAHGLILHAIGRVGASILSSGEDYKDYMPKLAEIDWSRSNRALWEGRAMIGGKISKSHNCLVLSTNIIKKHLGVPLGPEEIKLEKSYLREV